MTSCVTFSTTLHPPTPTHTLPRTEEEEPCIRTRFHMQLPLWACIAEGKEEEEEEEEKEGEETEPL